MKTEDPTFKCVERHTPIVFIFLHFNLELMCPESQFLWLTYSKQQVGVAGGGGWWGEGRRGRMSPRCLGPYLVNAQIDFQPVFL